MGNSLFDQLKSSGLVNKNKAQKAKRGQYESKKQKNKKGTSAQASESKQLAEKVHSDKVERDRQLNQQRKAEAEQKAIGAQIKQLIETNHIDDSDGEIAYNFTDKNVVKRIYVSEKAHQHLSAGQLAIAKLGESYKLVPVPVAEKIKQRDEQSIIMIENSSETVLDENDPYADYKIPDDLMW